MFIKTTIKILIVIVVAIVGYFTFLYYANFSEGVRSGELIKFSHKGMIFKTYEGELNQGISGNKVFAFSVEDKEIEIIKQMNELQGQYVKLTYKERYKTFPWWGETKYFITDIKKAKSPHFIQ